MTRRDLSAIAVIMVCVAVVVTALLSTPPSETDRVAALAGRLSCPVCESESIADSPSAIARDLHDLIAEQVADGWSDDEVEAFFVAAYGEEVLLDPPLDRRTMALWLVPALGLLVGVIVILRRHRPEASRDLTPDEMSLLDAAMRDAGEADR